MQGDSDVMEFRINECNELRGVLNRNDNWINGLMDDCDGQCEEIQYNLFDPVKSFVRDFKLRTYD